jgi:hypothetical protein
MQEGECPLVDGSRGFREGLGFDPERSTTCMVPAGLTRVHNALEWKLNAKDTDSVPLLGDAMPSKGVVGSFPERKVAVQGIHPDQQLIQASTFPRDCNQPRLVVNGRSFGCARLWI